jgi:hypothetical protein
MHNPDTVRLANQLAADTRSTPTGHTPDTPREPGIGLSMDAFDIDEIAEVNYSGDNAEIVDVRFKDGTTKQFNGSEHPEILALLNHWTPPTA